MKDTNLVMVNSVADSNAERAEMPDEKTSDGKSEDEKVESLLNVSFNDEENFSKDQVKTRSSQNNLPKFLRNINTPLIPLRFSLFCWFGAGLTMAIFVPLYMKQNGLSLEQLSVIFVMQPFFQFLAPAISGIVSDKLGRSKPVLQANLLIAVVAANSILFIPSLKTNPCSDENSINCYTQSVDNLYRTEHCVFYGKHPLAIECTLRCSGKRYFHIEDLCFKKHILECDPVLHNIIPHDLKYHLDNITTATCVREHEDHHSEEHEHIDANNLTWCHLSLLNDCNSTVCELNTKATTQCDSHEGKTHLFVISLILMVIFDTFLSNSYRIFDVTVMSMVKTHNSDFGRQRFWAIVGSTTWPALAGLLISSISSQGGPLRYDAVFYLFNALVILTLATTWKLNVAIDPPAKNMMRKIIRLLKNMDILAFLWTIFTVGTTWGFLRIYFSWYLKDLGASSILLGLIPALSNLLGLPFLFTSNWFLKKIGSVNLLILSLIGHAARCLGYSFLVNPWWALIYQVFEILTYHLLWVTVITHSDSLAPSGLKATVIATAGGVHFGLGKASGSLIGGIVMSRYGGRTAFRVMAIICTVVAALYALYTYCRKKCRRKTEDVENAESQSMIA